MKLRLFPSISFLLVLVAVELAKETRQVRSFHSSSYSGTASTGRFPTDSTIAGRSDVFFSSTNPSRVVELFAEAESGAVQAATDPLLEKRRRPLTPKEISERMGLSPLQNEYPKHFDDELLDKMRQTLLTLEKRVKEGNGSIDASETELFVSNSRIILDEMKGKEYERLEDASSPESAPTRSGGTTNGSGATAEPGSSQESESPGAETQTTSNNAVVESATIETKNDAKAAETPLPDGNEKEKSRRLGDIHEDDQEDGPKFDPSGGSGSLAKGTANTYIIPNMEEMSPEEYQKALQQSIIDRQTKRKESGKYGNRATWDYLNNLTGESGVLKEKK